MKRVKKVALALAALPMMAVPALVGPSPQAVAATATMAGMFNSAPKYTTITSDGQSLCPCRAISYDTSPGLIGIADGVRALEPWIATTPGSKTVVAYSKGTHAALGWLRENADELPAHRIEFVLLGSPETPGNGGWRVGHNLQSGLPPTNDFQNVTFVVRQYDSVADSPVNRFNFLAMINASFSTHLEGYDGLDLDNPDAVYVDPKTGATTLYFRTDLLPMLSWMDWFATPEQLAEWDATLRPLIEAAYARPVEIPDPDYALTSRLTLVAQQAVLETTAASAPQSGPPEDAAGTEAPSGTADPDGIAIPDSHVGELAETTGAPGSTDLVEATDPDAEGDAEDASPEDASPEEGGELVPADDAADATTDAEGIDAGSDEDADPTSSGVDTPDQERGPQHRLQIGGTGSGGTSGAGDSDAGGSDTGSGSNSGTETGSA